MKSVFEKAIEIKKKKVLKSNLPQQRKLQLLSVLNKILKYSNQHVKKGE